MTRKGYDMVKDELDRLKKIERPKNIQDIAEARAHGDLSENAEYSAAKEKQSFLEGRIRELETKLVEAEIIDTSNLSADKVVFGATVVLLDLESEEEKKYTLVGQDEADMKVNKISIHSPVAKALVGNKVGNTVKIKAPARTIEYEILKIYFE
ncbi:MAG TPA: transcription elongation factor GreA [Nitrospiria bacterium]|nr:transcription elongation factor GreA [Nitrospiria bacterium]